MEVHHIIQRMGKREYVLWKIKQLEAERKQKEADAKRNAPYNPASMNMERMPLGCWMWVFGAITLVIYLIKSC